MLLFSVAEVICRDPELIKKFGMSLKEENLQEGVESFNTKGTFTNKKMVNQKKRKSRKQKNLDMSDEFLGEPNWLKKERKLKSSSEYKKARKSGANNASFGGDVFEVSEEDKIWIESEESGKEKNRETISNFLQYVNYSFKTYDAFMYTFFL